MEELLKVFMQGIPGPVKVYIGKIIYKSSKEIIEGYRENPPPPYGLAPNAAKYVSAMMDKIIEYHHRVYRFYEVEFHEIIQMAEDDKKNEHMAYTAVEAFYDMYIGEKRFEQIRRESHRLSDQLKGEMEGLFRLLDNWYDYNWGNDDNLRKQIEKIHPDHVISLVALKAIYEIGIKMEHAVVELGLVEKTD
ncbi:MAG: hypothetical protein SCK57_02975 [Bacillota bacterium]|nr:hypothetical protein [Bacillota bacterium]